jgi:hypothetical protein
LRGRLPNLGAPAELPNYQIAQFGKLRGTNMQVKRLVAAPPARTAKVKFLKAVTLGPDQDAYKGEIYELPKYMATQFVNSGQAEYTDEGDPSEHDDPGAATHQAGYQTVTLEQPTNRDPKPKKKG